MNTEINFLEKQPKKYLAPLIFGLVFIVLLVIVFAILLFQQNSYSKAIEMEKSQINQFETLIQEHSQETVEIKELQALEAEIISIQAQEIPNVSLYRNTVEKLASPDQLSSFSYADSEQFVLEARFEDLDSVASYVGALLEQAYIVNADLSNVSHTGELYQATLTFNVGIDVLREELGIND